MKKNLTKLALSGVALAAVAATLGTSTYAWYTTNPTVNANNIVGASSDTGSSSIFINKDHLVDGKVGGKNPVWSSTVTFAGSEFNLATGKLIPVQPTDTTGTFQTAKPKNATELTVATANANDVIKFELNFKGSKIASTADAINVYLKSITIKNTTPTALPQADNLLYGQKYVDAADANKEKDYTADQVGVANNAGVYSVDFVKALGMQIDAADGNTDQTFALAPYQDEDNSTVAAENVPTATAHAHDYYNAVMDLDYTAGMISTGKALTGALAKQPIATLNRDGVTASTVTFYIYLNGWNDFCYDACQGQNFSINMSFTSDLGSAIGA